MICFHGNAEDIGYSSYFFKPLSNIWKCHILAVEYPTYGVYKDRDLNQDNIIEDSLHIYDFLIQKIGLQHDQIIVFGRSMGSGGACALA
jgi:abhydrolase domain-containing protein 17